MKDMHSNIKVLRAIEPKAVGTTGAANGSISPILDRRGYNSAEFVINYGSGGTSVADTTTPVILESDTAVSGDFTSVANADLIGTEAGAACPAENPRTSGVGKNVATKIGYKGIKRYLRIRLYGLGTATNIVSANLILGKPENGPVAGQTG